MKSPFKFLDAYTPEDREIFFGRKNEVETLYQLVFKSRLLLVYGQSGTGKTSLVQCGLGGKFDLTDWYPVQVRRNDDINQSLQRALATPAGGSLRKDSLTETIAWLYKNYLRPVYLIFDQLEELFILGTQTEQDKFVNGINEIIEADVPCKIILIMREEYIAQLYHFEQVIPTLFDRRLRVEPMSYNNVSDVITGSCTTFNIRLDKPEESVSKIIDSISGGKSGIQLPYLQVYLDRLWREDFERTYPEGYKDQEGHSNYPSLEFTLSEIEELGDIENVLEKFLRQQEDQIQQQLKKDFKQMPPDAVQRVLDVFVTEEGTKQPVSYRRSDHEILLDDQFQQKLLPLPPGALTAILNALERARILRFTDQLIELAHDSLAELIDSERSGEQRQLNQIKKRIAAAFVEQQESGVFLTARQLTSIEEYLPKLNLDEQLSRFIADSHEVVRKREEAEKRAQEEKLRLTQEKLEAEQKARKRQRIFTAMIGLALIVAVILGGMAFFQNQTISEQKQVLEKQSKELELQKDQAELALKNFQQAEAEKVISEVEGMLIRATDLDEKGYSEQGREWRQRALDLLTEYQGNPHLENLTNEVSKALK